MDPALYDFDRQQEEDTWRILTREVPALEEAASLQPIDPIHLFKPPIHENLATYFLLVRRVHGTAEFLTNDQLIALPKKR